MTGVQRVIRALVTWCAVEDSLREVRRRRAAWETAFSQQITRSVYPTSAGNVDWPGWRHQRGGVGRTEDREDARDIVLGAYLLLPNTTGPGPWAHLADELASAALACKVPLRTFIQALAVSADKYGQGR